MKTYVKMAFQKVVRSQEVLSLIGSMERAAANDYQRLCPVDPDNPNYQPGAVTGAGMHELPEFPFPVLPQDSDTTTEILRKQLVQLASENNWHDFDRLDGTPVHGNINSDEVSNNTPWTIRGTAASRADRAQEEVLVLMMLAYSVKMIGSYSMPVFDM